MTQADERRQMVTFRVGDDLFAAEIRVVERVLRCSPPRPIPDLPPWMAGVIDYVGHVLPVIDLRARFELASATRPLARVLVVDIGGARVGAVVDEVLEVATLTAADISAPPELFKGLAGAYLQGTFSRNEQVIVVLDTHALLTSRERLLLEQAAAEVPHA
ncbi:MAG: chemotaxis protein CheW [Gemmatimonadaceae bacterium]|nr:chemotaxis protein CheW [Gemmatimonadaceae bacterium]